MTGTVTTTADLSSVGAISSAREQIVDQALTRLAARIIKQACEDYEQIIVALYVQKDPQKRLFLLEAKVDVESFFYGSWFGQLSNMNPDKILQRIKEIAKGTIQKKLEKQKKQEMNDLKKGL